MINFTFSAVKFLFMIAASLLWLTSPLRAATYNFYFNNSEQGDNSTANPTLVVKDGKQEKPEKKDEKADEPVDPPKEAVKSEPVARGAWDGPTRPYFRHLRLAAAGFGGRSQSTYSEDIGFFDPDWYPGASRTVTGERSHSGLLLSATFFPVPQLGITGYLGGISGLELELSPIAGGPVELGLLAGWMRTGLLFQHTGFSAGARASFNFNDVWGVNVAARTTPFGGDDFKLTMVEAGVHFRL